MTLTYNLLSDRGIVPTIRDHVTYLGLNLGVQLLLQPSQWQGYRTNHQRSRYLPWSEPWSSAPPTTFSVTGVSYQPSEITLPTLIWTLEFSSSYNIFSDRGIVPTIRDHVTYLGLNLGVQLLLQPSQWQGYRTNHQSQTHHVSQVCLKISII